MQLILGKRFLSHRRAQMWKSELLKQARTNKNHPHRPECTPVLQCPPGLHKALSSLFSIHEKMLTHQGGVDFNRSRTPAPFPSCISLGTGTVESALFSPESSYWAPMACCDNKCLGLISLLENISLKKKDWPHSGLTSRRFAWSPQCIEG